MPTRSPWHDEKSCALTRRATDTVLAVFEVRRDDGELCGFVVADDGQWSARTVFGAQLGLHAHREEAERQVEAEGLASLTERWTLVDGTSGEEQIACIQESSPTGVTVALGYYSMPGVATLAVSSEDLAVGRWTLRRG